MIDIVAWVGSAFVLVSYLQRDALRLHAINVVACVAFLVYDIALALHPMTALNVVVLMISAVQIRRLRLVEPEPIDYPARSQSANASIMALTSPSG